MFPFFFHTFACNYGSTQNIHCVKPKLRCSSGCDEAEGYLITVLVKRGEKLLPLLLRGDNSFSVVHRVTVSGAQLACSACPAFNRVMHSERRRSVSLTGRRQCEFCSPDVIWWNHVRRIPARPLDVHKNILLRWGFDVEV